MQKIIYQHGSGVAVVTPADCGLTVKQIAEKDVPKGVKYWIIDDSELPSDRSQRSGWTLTPNRKEDGAGK